MNVVLIVLDDLGWEKLSWWPAESVFPSAPGAVPEGGYPPTPRLEELASYGTIFTNVWSSPVCSSSRAMMLTGRHGHRTGATRNIGGSSGFQLMADELTIPRILRAHKSSFQTAAFGKWHLADYSFLAAGVAPADPIRLGFDEFHGLAGNPPSLGGTDHFYWEKIDATQGSTSHAIVGAGPATDSGRTPSAAADWTGTHTCNDFASWVGSLDPSDPFFGYVCFSPPHEPFQVPPLRLVSPTTSAQIASFGKQMGQLVDEDCSGCMDGSCCDWSATDGFFPMRARFFNWMIESVDTQIGMLVDAVEASGRLDQTVFVIVSDNGSPRKAMAQQSPPVPPYIRSHGKTTPYNLGARVPMIITAGRDIGNPAVQPNSSDKLVSLTDMWRTTTWLAGVDDQLIAGQISTLPPVSTPAGSDMDWQFDSYSALPHYAPAERSFALIELANGLTPEWQVPASTFVRAVVASPHPAGGCNDAKLVMRKGNIGEATYEPTGVEHGDYEYFDLFSNDFEDPSDQACPDADPPSQPCDPVSCDAQVPEECSSAQMCETSLDIEPLAQRLCDWLCEGN